MIAQRNFLDEPPPEIRRDTAAAIDRHRRRRPSLRADVERRITEPLELGERIEQANRELQTVGVVFVVG